MTRLVALLLAVSLPGFTQLANGVWKTDLSRKSIDLRELMSGGPPKDGIPSVDRPKFISPASANWLSPKELVIAVEIRGESRAYPLQILMWHELVNDTLNGVSILVSYCPLCNSGIVFDRTIEGKPVEFGVSGMLRNSDMVMYDRATDSLWQQITGEAIVGQYTGKTLKMLPSQMVPFEEFRNTYPDGVVLSRETGFQRQYGHNPYRGYEWGSGPIMPVRQNRTPGLAGMEKLVVVRDKKSYRAYPFSDLKTSPVVEDKVDGRNIVVLYSREGLIPVDAAAMDRSRATGSVGVFLPEVDGKRLRFRSKDGAIVDRETGSTWSVTGMAVAGQLKGKRLQSLEHGVYFTFAWMAFEPTTFVYGRPARLNPGGLGEPPSAQQRGDSPWPP